MQQARLMGCITLLVIAAGLFFGLLGFTQMASWSPRQYVPRPGDCFVPPQGDPLYDAHYAQNVNVPNCEAMKTQSESKLIDAQTTKLNAQTGLNLLGLYAIAAVFLIVGGYVVLQSFKG